METNSHNGDNSKLQKDLEHALIEIDRLRSKLTVDVPKPEEARSFDLGQEVSIDSLKGSINIPGLGGSRNAEGNQRLNTTEGAGFGKKVPALDFRKLKKVQEYKDWYSYAVKLEDSVNYLRQRVKDVEDDNNALNQKFRKEKQAKEHFYMVNEKLNRALKKANLKIQEAKEKYKEKFSRRCANCNHELELTMPNFEGTLEQVQVTQLDQSFTHGRDEDDEDAADRLNNGENILENLIDEQNIQIESGDRSGKPGMLTGHSSKPTATGSGEGREAAHD